MYIIPLRHFGKQSAGGWVPSQFLELDRQRRLLGELFLPFKVRIFGGFFLFWVPDPVPSHGLGQVWFFPTYQVRGCEADL